MRPTSAPAPSVPVVRAADAATLLAAVPRLTGMWPRRSLVLAVFTGSRTRTALRIDLPAPGADLDAFADTVVGLVLRVDEVDGVVPVVYTDDLFARAARGDGVALLEAVRGCADRAGLHVPEALLAAADGWAAVRSGRRPVRRDLGEIDDGPIPNDLIDVDAAAALPLRPPGACRSFADRVAALLADGTGPDSRFGPEVVDAFEAALASTRSAFGLPDEGLDLLGAALEEPRLRDVVLLQAGWGPRFGALAHRRCVVEAGDLRPDEPVALAFSGGDMARPDPDRVERAIRRLRAVAALTEPADRAPVLSALAWLHWSLGRGSVAGRLVDQARAADPGYSLADLLAAMLERGMLPEWAYRAVPGSAAGRAWLG